MNPATTHTITPTVPAQKSDRVSLWTAVRDFVSSSDLVSPLSREDLETMAEELCTQTGTETQYRDFLMVLLNTESWKKTVSMVPYERRMLLLPQCLRTRSDCPAEMDDLGLLCENCDRCPLGKITQLAEDLGYVTLIAEGTTVVTRLFEQGKIDCVVGASCMETLEKTFPLSVREAVPSLAVPLNSHGCDNTSVDTEQLIEMIRLRNPDQTRERINIPSVKNEVRSWFDADQIGSILESSQSETSRIATDWVAESGKRWRPIVMASAFQALSETTAPFSATIKKAATAVECFHKASLVHDDIEDNDTLRNGHQTLHRRHGIPIALNIGDYLIGEGYRLISSLDLDSQRKCQMLSIASQCHHTLCLGQGEELAMLKADLPPTPHKLREIFANKTSPAFETGLRLGAACANADSKTHPILSAYSSAIGIAYQINDDLHDLNTDTIEANPAVLKTSFLLAMAWESAKEAERKDLAQFWNNPNADTNKERLLCILNQLNIREQASDIIETYQRTALESLRPLQNTDLKILLWRLSHRIFEDE